MKKRIPLSILTLTAILLTSCVKSDKTAHSEVSYDESAIAEANSIYISEIAEEARKNNDTITLPILVDENNKVTDSADVKLISSVYEIGEIKKVEGFKEHVDTIFHYNEYFDADGILNPEYAFAEISIEITAENSQELYLTQFNLSFISENQFYSYEPKFIDKCVDFGNPHKGSTVSVKANTPETITICYIVEKSAIENIEEAYLDAFFTSFEIVDGSNSLALEFKKA